MYSGIFQKLLSTFVFYSLIVKPVLTLHPRADYFHSSSFQQEPFKGFNVPQHPNTPYSSPQYPSNSLYQQNIPRHVNLNQFNPVIPNSGLPYNQRPGLNLQTPSMLPSFISSSPPTTKPSGYIHFNPDNKQSGKGRSHDEHLSALRKLTEDLRREYLMKSINNPTSVDPSVIRRLDLATRPREARRGIVEDLNVNAIGSGFKPPVVPIVASSPGDKSTVSETRSSSHSTQAFIGSQYQPEYNFKSNSTLTKGDNGVTPDMENGWTGLMTPTMSYTNRTSTVPSKTYVRTESKSSKAQNSFSKKQLEIKRTPGSMNASKKLKELNARVRMNSKSLNTKNSFAHKLKKVLNSGKSKHNKVPKISINKQATHPHAKVMSAKQSPSKLPPVKVPLKLSSRFSAETFNPKTYPPHKAIRNNKRKYINRISYISSQSKANNTSEDNDRPVISDSTQLSPSQEVPTTIHSVPDSSSFPPKPFQPSMANPFEPSDSSMNEIIVGTKTKALDSSGSNNLVVSTSMSFFSPNNNPPPPLLVTKAPSTSQPRVEQLRNNMQTNFIPVTQPSLNPMMAALKQTEQKNEILQFNPSTNMLTSTAQIQPSQKSNDRSIFHDNVMSAATFGQNVHPTQYQPHVHLQSTRHPRFQNSWGFIGNQNPFRDYPYRRPETGRMIPPRISFFPQQANEVEDDSEEEKDKDPRDSLPKIVDPHHPLVQNALHPLGNPAKQPEQYIRKKTKVIDPSSLVPLNKVHVYIGLALSWMLVLAAFCVYHSHQARKLGKGAADEKIGQRPLLLNIPQDGSNPFFSGRALDLGSNWNFTKVLEYIDIAQKTYEGFDWYKLDCQKRALCELSQKDTWAGETGRKIANNYMLSVMDALDGIPIPKAIQAYLQSYKEAISQGKNSSKDCGAVYNQCNFSIKEVIANAGKPKKNTF